MPEVLIKAFSMKAIYNIDLENAMINLIIPYI